MEKLVNRQTMRFVVVGMIILAMLIPLAFVYGIAAERQAYFESVFQDIAVAWGQQQDLAGPFIVIPELARYSTEDDAGAVVWHERRRDRVYLPDTLHINVQVNHQYRSRSIYEVPVYEASVEFTGTFTIPEPGHGDVRVLRDEARLLVGITHTQAISSMSEIQIAGEELAFEASTGQTWLGSGVHVDLPDLTLSANLAFAFNLDVKGTRTLGISPVGSTSQIEMASSWPHPSFSGRYLPQSYDIQDDGFSATWSVHELARNMPGNWLVNERDAVLSESWASVSLFQPVTNYTVVDRGIKYGVLFIGLTFLTFVCFEMMTAVRFHYIQYAVVGAGLVLFYLALLSLSEHITFALSYVIATALLSGLIGWYVWVMTYARRLTLWILSVLVTLYVGLYVLLQLEAYALLVGTGILFVGLFALMYTTKNLTETQAEISAS